MPKLKLTQNKILLIAGLAGILLVCAAGAVVWVNYMPSSGEEDPIALTPIEDVDGNAQEYVVNNDIEGGLEYYDKQIEARSDVGEKQRLLLNKSNFALRVEKNDVALESAREADKIQSSRASLMALAQIYDSTGDRQQAIAYYKKLIEMSSSDDMSSRYKPDWERRVEELES